LSEKVKDFPDSLMWAYGQWVGAHDGFNWLRSDVLFREFFDDIVCGDDTKENIVVKDREIVDVIFDHDTSDFFHRCCGGKFRCVRKHGMEFCLQGHCWFHECSF